MEEKELDEYITLFCSVHKACRFVYAHLTISYEVVDTTGGLKMYDGVDFYLWYYEPQEDLDIETPDVSFINNDDNEKISVGDEFTITAPYSRNFWAEIRDATSGDMLYRSPTLYRFE